MGLFPLLIVIAIIVAGAMVMMRRRQDQALVKRVTDVKTQAECAFAQKNEPIDSYGDVFLGALRDQDWKGAYEQLAQALKSQFGSVEGLQGWIDGNNPHLKSWDYQSRVAYRGIVNPDTGESRISGGLLYNMATFVDGRQGRVSLQFISESEQLRVSEVKMDDRTSP